MQYYFYVINTVALVASILFDIYVNRKTSVFSSLLMHVLVLETICGYFLAKWFDNNFIIYNFLIAAIIAHYIYIFGGHLTRKKILIAWLLSCLAVLFLAGFTARVHTEIYIVGLFVTSYLIVSFFYRQLFVVESNFIWFKPKSYIGIGILLFFACSFPLLFFFQSITKLGGAYLPFYDLLMIGNIILSTSYLMAVIIRWKKI